MGAGEGVRPKPVSTMSLGAMSAAQLSPAEAVSMSALLDDCCEKLAFLGTISPDVNEHKMEESNRIGDEMSSRSNGSSRISSSSSSSSARS